MRKGMLFILAMLTSLLVKGNVWQYLSSDDGKLNTLTSYTESGWYKIFANINSDEDYLLSATSTTSTTGSYIQDTYWYCTSSESNIPVSEVLYPGSSTTYGIKIGDSSTIASDLQLATYGFAYKKISKIIIIFANTGKNCSYDVSCTFGDYTETKANAVYANGINSKKQIVTFTPNSTGRELSIAVAQSASTSLKGPLGIYGIQVTYEDTDVVIPGAVTSSVAADGGEIECDLWSTLEFSSQNAESLSVQLKKNGKNVLAEGVYENPYSCTFNEIGVYTLEVEPLLLDSEGEPIIIPHTHLGGTYNILVSEMSDATAESALYQSKINFSNSSSLLKQYTDETAGMTYTGVAITGNVNSVMSIIFAKNTYGGIGVTGNSSNRDLLEIDLYLPKGSTDIDKVELYAGSDPNSYSGSIGYTGGKFILAETAVKLEGVSAESSYENLDRYVYTPDSDTKYWAVVPINHTENITIYGVIVTYKANTMKQEPDLSVDSSEFTMYLSDVAENKTYDQNVWHNTGNLDVIYTIDDAGVAEVDEESGDVTPMHAGDTYVNMEFAGNGFYVPYSPSYELEVELIRPQAEGEVPSRPLIFDEADTLLPYSYLDSDSGETLETGEIHIRYCSGYDIKYVYTPGIAGNPSDKHKVMAKAADISTYETLENTVEDGSSFDGVIYPYGENNSQWQSGTYEIYAVSQSDGSVSKAAILNFAIPTSVRAVEEAADADVEPVYYNLQGMRVEHPEHGVYIQVVGTNAEKIVK